MNMNNKQCNAANVLPTNDVFMEPIAPLLKETVPTTATSHQPPARATSRSPSKCSPPSNQSPLNSPRLPSQVINPQENQSNIKAGMRTLLSNGLGIIKRFNRIDILQAGDLDLVKITC
jgi:hypothetical protein